MAQGYDKYELDNQTGQSFRFALNDILEAAATQNSGDNSPNTTNTSYPYQVWVDTTNDIVKIRDAATAGSWYSLYSVDSDGKPTGAVSYGSYTIATNDTAGNGGTTAITVDTSQNVGIGTTPAANRKVHVQGTGFTELLVEKSDATTAAIMLAADSGVGSIYTRSTASDSTAIPLTFHTGNTQRAAIDSSGRLLVGTSSSSDACIAAFEGHSSNGTQQAIVFLRRGSTTPSNNDNLGEFKFSDSAGKQGALIKAVCDGTWTSGSSHPGRLVFSTTADGAASPTTRMELKADGRLYVQGVYDFTASASTVVVQPNGLVARTSSSIKYKTNVETIQDQYSDAILNVRPVWYQSLSKLDNPDWGWWGFIAEEVAEIDPRLVHWRTVESVVQEDGSRVETPCDPVPEDVAYDRFVPHLLNLIKRQKKQIELQGASIAALETRLSALEGA